MPEEREQRIVRLLLDRGYNADREAVTLLAGAPNLEGAVDRVLEAVPGDAISVTGGDVRPILNGRTDGQGTTNPSPSGGNDAPPPVVAAGPSPVETLGSTRSGEASVDVASDVTGESTGIGDYENFVAVFRDRYKRLSKLLRGRLNRRPVEAVEAMKGGGEVELIGMVNDIRSTANGHRLIELEDPTGTFPVLVLKDRELAATVEELLLDEVIGVKGSLSDDGGIVFADELLFPDVPRTHSPNRADRPVAAALVSDLHVGSQEFAEEAWESFAAWLHSDAAARVEYLLICGDMVEGVGVYPDQDEELSIVDIYDQYERFAEHLKDVPGDLEIVMVPGNHDAVRLAEPQPAPAEDLRDIMTAHDARILGNPSTVTIDGVSVLMYHGMSLDEVIAASPAAVASYEEPHLAMCQLLKKRHVAPTFGGKMRIAPEERDWLVIEAVPDIFHGGHVHKFGAGAYNGVSVLNTGCWQHQTAFQRSVNIDPDVGCAAVVDLQTFDVQLRKFV